MMCGAFDVATVLVVTAAAASKAIPHKKKKMEKELVSSFSLEAALRC